MKFKSIALPRATPGVIVVGTMEDEEGKEIKGKLVVPDQSLSLHEIIARFTRGEAVPVGHDVQFHESEDDLEKVAKKDLVDRAEFVDKLKRTQAEFKKQEARNAAKAKKKLEDEALEKARKELQEKGLKPVPGGEEPPPAK